MAGCAARACLVCAKPLWAVAKQQLVACSIECLQSHASISQTRTSCSVHDASCRGLVRHWQPRRAFQPNLPSSTYIITVQPWWPMVLSLHSKLCYACCVMHAVYAVHAVCAAVCGRSEGMGPIAYLQANKIEVRLKQVPFAPNFMFAFTGAADLCGGCSLHMCDGSSLHSRPLMPQTVAAASNGSTVCPPSWGGRAGLGQPVHIAQRPPGGMLTWLPHCLPLVWPRPCHRQGPE